MNPQSISLSLSLFVLLLCLYVSLPLRSGGLARVHRCPLTCTHTHTHKITAGALQAVKLYHESFHQAHTNTLGAKCLHVRAHFSKCLHKAKMIHVCGHLPTHRHRHTCTYTHTDTHKQTGLWAVTFPFFWFQSHARVSRTDFPWNKPYVICMCVCVWLRVSLSFSPARPFSIPTRLVAPLPCKQSQV